MPLGASPTEGVYSKSRQGTTILAWFIGLRVRRVDPVAYEKHLAASVIYTAQDYTARVMMASFVIHRVLSPSKVQSMARGINS